MAHSAGIRNFRIVMVDPEDQSFGGYHVQIYKPYLTIHVSVREHEAYRSTKDEQERLSAEMTYLKRGSACTLHARHTNNYFLETRCLITLKYTK